MQLEYIGNCTHMNSDLLEDIMENADYISPDNHPVGFDIYFKHLIKHFRNFSNHTDFNEQIFRKDLINCYSKLYISRVTGKNEDVQKYLIYQFSAIEYIYQVS